MNHAAVATWRSLDRAPIGEGPVMIDCCEADDHIYIVGNGRYESVVS